MAGTRRRRSTRPFDRCSGPHDLLYKVVVIGVVMVVSEIYCLFFVLIELVLCRTVMIVSRSWGLY